ncbi:MAG: hypothetical protein CVV27_04045 [Candidatus Melainabacteria bacterium HGW-Melainabacteria-1]|nr:MAG: hypothetical protein CVV27_04045 [Candidatus Melainabacteria bacterium HGW-Melainabacteria-1]
MRPKTPLAVIVRRGPSKVTCTLGWDRRDDSITVGQWLRARIYERRSDISADGRYLVYFAMNGRWDSESKGAYTAISRAPWLKALQLWPKGDCWQGGGLFTDKRTFWLNGCHAAPIAQYSSLRQTEKFPGVAHYNAECLGVYFNRLQRDGWALKSFSRDQAIFEKSIKGWILRKYAFASVKHPQGRGVYYDEHELIQVSTGESLLYPEWEWAEIDGQRLVWTEAGRLCAAKLDPQGLQQPVVLADLNQMAFEAIAAPY